MLETFLLIVGKGKGLINLERIISYQLYVVVANQHRFLSSLRYFVRWLLILADLAVLQKMEVIKVTVITSPLLLLKFSSFVDGLLRISSTFVHLVNSLIIALELNRILDFFSQAIHRRKEFVNKPYPIKYDLDHI